MYTTINSITLIIWLGSANDDNLGCVICATLQDVVFKKSYDEDDVSNQV
jgi:hypothetical protein